MTDYRKPVVIPTLIDLALHSLTHRFNRLQANGYGDAVADEIKNNGFECVETIGYKHHLIESVIKSYSEEECKRLGNIIDEFYEAL